MQIASVSTALPSHAYDQEVLIDALERLWADGRHREGRVRQLCRAVQVGRRHLALPVQAYETLSGFAEANRNWVEVGTKVGLEAVRDALDEAGLRPCDVDALFFTTVTGLSVPSLDARIVNRLGMRPDVKRWPLFGLGCLAGAAGVARLNDYLRAWPDQVAVLLSVELCSLTFQRDDPSVRNLIASALFGDGAAAVVGIGKARAAREQREGPRVVATESCFYFDTEDVMGWDLTDRGFSLVLAPTVPEVARTRVVADVDRFLAGHGLARQDVRGWVLHPGGPRVIEALQQALDLTDADLEAVRRSLWSVGNLSSASVLHVLRDTLRSDRRPPRGASGLLLAMGPGFASELVLLEW